MHRKINFVRLLAAMLMVAVLLIPLDAIAQRRGSFGGGRSFGGFGGSRMSAPRSSSSFGSSRSSGSFGGSRSSGSFGGIKKETTFAGIESLKVESAAQQRAAVDHGHTYLLFSNSKMCAPSATNAGGSALMTRRIARDCSSKPVEEVMGIARQRSCSAGSNASSGS